MATTIGNSTSETLTASSMAKRLGVSVATVRRWADAGHLSCVRTPGGQRRFPLEQDPVEQHRIAIREAAIERIMADGPALPTHPRTIARLLARLAASLESDDPAKPALDKLSRHFDRRADQLVEPR